MEHELYVSKLRERLYLLDEAHGVSGFLLVGDDRACVIDTMNGYNDLYKAAREITDRPLFVINTHGHPDHIYGNMYFDEVYLNPKDWELAESFYQDPEFREMQAEAGCEIPPFKPIGGGETIDLGGITLETYEMPGHTAGGTMLLWKEERILFTGDAINHHLWMMLDGCPPMEQLVEALDRILFLEERADVILHGHARDFDDISLIRCLRQGAVEICEGRTEGDTSYTWFGGVAMQHPFALEPGKHYSQQDGVIVYNPA